MSASNGTCPSLAYRLVRGTFVVNGFYGVRMEYTHRDAAVFGSLQPTGHGPEVREVAPTRCANGHALTPPNVQVFTGPRPGAELEGQVRGWRCWECGDITYSN